MQDAARVRRGEAAVLKEAGFALYAADAGGRPFPELADRPARLALAVGNEWQEILTGQFVGGRTGNEILAATRAEAASAR